MLFFFADAPGGPRGKPLEQGENQQRPQPTYNTAGLEANQGHIGEDSLLPKNYLRLVTEYTARLMCSLMSHALPLHCVQRSGECILILW